jgi:hypothetical protein
MDKTMVYYHTPKTKRQSKQWIKKSLPGPAKAKVLASHNKQMVLAGFDSKGLMYMHIIPKRITISANYTLAALGKFLKNLKKKRPRMVQQEWFLHWDNVPVYTAAVVPYRLAARAIQVLPLPTYLPNLASADFFLFMKVMVELAGLCLSQ